VRAVTLPAHGGIEVLTLTEIDDPVPGVGEILVRVQGSAMNRADVLQRMGLYPDPVRRAVEIPGIEYAGTVAALGPGVTEWSVGDRVMGIEAGACHAELVVTHARQAMPVPASLDLADAAAVPEVFLTAWDALVVQGGLTSGRWALVHAGASGVGTAAIQIARAIGAHVIVTCSAGKAEACRQLGADLVLERSPSDWLAGVQQARPDGVDVVLDVIGGEETNRNLRAVRREGTIVQVGLMGGGRTEVDLGLLLTKRITWIGTTLRARPLEQKIAICRRFAAEVLPLFDDGRLRPVIDSRFPIDRIGEAHQRIEADANVGKILLEI
jgi:putative PIG3 family NAD(P)H quinone oxidoreductase